MSGKRFVALVICLPLLVAAARAQSSPRSLSLGVDVYGGYATAVGGGFEDPQVLPHHTAGWLNDVHDGGTFGAQVSLGLPFGLRPYVGYQQGAFPERSTNAVLWQNIYGQDFQRSGSVITTHQVTNRLRSLVLGLQAALSLPGRAWQPFVSAEVRRHDLTSRTTVAGYGENFWTFAGPRSGAFTGHSDMTTRQAWGGSIGAGMAIAVGPFHLVPELKYVSTTTHVAQRQARWTMTPDDPNLRQSAMTIKPTVPEGQNIHHRYLTFQLGLRYDLQVFKW